MAEAKWIKVTTDIFDDDKILLIESMPGGDSIIVIWFKLLCLAGKQNNSGVFLIGDKIPYTDEMLATIFRRKKSIVKLALQTFEEFGMIEIIDGVITLPNWGKYQNIDQLESKKQFMKNYMKEYRQKQKEISNSKTNCKVNSKVNSKANVSRTDKIREEKNRKEQIREEVEEVKEENEITPPTLSQVMDYVKENNLSVNPNRYYTYYSERDWKTSNGNPIDWKAKIQEWDFADKQKNKNQTSNNPFLELAKDENLF